MGLRIKTLLLAVALVCSTTSTASACIYIPILDPFYWMFGGCGYGYGNSGAGGGSYGYVNNGSAYGYGPNPYGVSRCIDDWLGYGYLRNQQGTLGHYPGRPISCYRPVFPRLLNPCAWFAPCPLFAPYGPNCGVTSPMVAPLAPPMPYRGQWQMPQVPMPAMMNPYGGNCNDPCGSQCMPQPMVQCQPAPVPVTTWRPMTVDRGNWQRVWVSRPVTMMVPQTQYVTPSMQMPMMGTPAMDYDCGDSCGMGNPMPGTEYMPGSEMIQDTGYPDMNSGSGCCGADNGFPQQGLQSGIPVVPQSTMLMSPGSMTMSQMSMPQTAFRQPYNIAPYSSMSRWYSNPGSANSGFAATSYRQQMASHPAYRMPMYSQQHSRNLSYNTAMMPSRQPAGWQMGSPRVAPMQMAPNQMAHMRPIPMVPQMMPPQFSPMRSQRPVSPLIGGTMPGTVYARSTIAGDIHGDHELPGPASAGVPVVPNSFSGRSPVQQASWSQPVKTSYVRRYPNTVQ